MTFDQYKRVEICGACIAGFFAGIYECASAVLMKPFVTKIITYYVGTIGSELHITTFILGMAAGIICSLASAVLAERSALKKDSLVQLLKMG